MAAAARKRKPQAPDIDAAMRACQTVGDLEALASVHDRHALWDQVLNVARKIHAPQEPTGPQLFTAFRKEIRERLVRNLRRTAQAHTV